MDLYEQSLNSIHTFLSAGYINEALKMIGALEQAFPDKRIELSNLKAHILFNNGKKHDALMKWVEMLDEFGNDEAFAALVENFLRPNQKTNEEKYKKNYERVSEYDKCFGQINKEPKWYVIEQNDNLIIALNEQERGIHTDKLIEYDYGKFENKPIFLEGAVFSEPINRIKELTHMPGITNGKDNGIVAAFTEWEWDCFMQIADLNEMLDDERLVLVIGEDAVKECYKDVTMPDPHQAFSLSGRELRFFQLKEDVVYERIEEGKLRQKNNEKEYADNKEERKRRIRDKKPRILFWTSRFTTVIQYHAKNAMKAAENLGCECFFLIEPDNIRWITNLEIYRVVEKFKPDVFFLIDHFRFESSEVIPKGILCVTWIQDPMEHIMDQNVCSKLAKNDIILNHLISYDYLKRLYEGRLIDAAVPANQDIYKPYDLTEDEKNRYGSDICIVCHASDLDKWLKNFLAKIRMEDKYKEVIKSAVIEYKNNAYKGKFYYSEEQFLNMINDTLDKEGAILNPEGAKDIAGELFKWFNQRVFRHCIVDWIIDAGFENIKLWGNGWKDEPKYSKYAMGSAENGEVLSKVYQASKIVVGNNIMTTAAARAWESMLSGAFYISNYIPEEYDWSDIRKIMPEGSFEIYHDRDELIDKLHYYLEHEDERKKMAEIGRQEALKRMTFEVLMKKVLDVLPEYLDD